MLTAALALLMVIATAAMISSTISNTRTVDELAEQALNSTALALAAAAEGILAERGDAGAEELRELLTDRVIAYALIASAGGFIRFHTNPRLTGTKLSETLNEASLMSMNMSGKRVTLQTGTSAYEFNYVLHRENGRPDLLRLVLHTFPADHIVSKARGMWWSVTAGIAALWIAGIMLVWSLRRYAGLQNRRQKQEQLAMIGQMTAVLAHEIRNAIGSVKGFTQWIDEKTEDADQRKAPLSLVLRGTGRIESLVNDLLLFSRDEAYVIEPINVVPVLGEALSLCVGSWQGQVELKVPEEVVGLADREKLLRVLCNGLRNALQSMGEEGTLGVSARAAGRWLAIELKDTGRGIDEETYRRLFTPFYTTKTSGTGLGLAYSKKVIEGMKGQITLSNRADTRGAVLTVRLVAPERT
ncbi:MAG TPA: ATP-binding protein [Dissulfurispiraceae bacterium]|nr:ATP-binding protein [Dissulfurispiraceae bacterium]